MISFSERRFFEMLRSVMLGLCCGLLSINGCGPGGPTLAPVKGVVKLDGEPKSKLLVTFTPTAGGQQALGTTNENGEFQLNTNGRKGALLGEHKVSITTVKDAPAAAPSSAASGPSGGDAYKNQARIAPAEFKLPKELIPDKYNKNTELVRQVEGSGNNFDFDLKIK
jgi:hypothetical protein